MTPRHGCARDVLDYIDALVAYLYGPYLYGLPLAHPGAYRGVRLDPPVPVAWEWSA